MGLREIRDHALSSESVGRIAGKRNLHKLVITDGVVESVDWLKCEYYIRLVDRKDVVKAYLAFNKNFWLLVGFPKRGDRVLVTHDNKVSCQIIASFDNLSEYALENNSDYEDTCFISEGTKNAG